jgi:hypothetical protein
MSTDIELSRTVDEMSVTTNEVELSTETHTKSGYPKPPFSGCEEVFFKDPCRMSGKTMRRAMERDGYIFKKITKCVPGVKYVYWHEDKKGTEVWFKSSTDASITDDVETYHQITQRLEERYTFVILRPKPHYNKNNKPSVEDSTDLSVDDEEIDLMTDDVQFIRTDTEHDTIQLLREDLSETSWAIRRLEAFKNNALYKDLFIIKDYTTYASPYPAWCITPAMQDEMDALLKTALLPRGETIIYDRHRCNLAWIRRDEASYEIRSNSVQTVQYVEHFIMRTLHQLVCRMLEQGLLHQLPPNAAQWTDAYFHMVENEKLRRMNVRTNKYRNKKHGKAKHLKYQARKGKKRQKL